MKSVFLFVFLLLFMNQGFADTVAIDDSCNTYFQDQYLNSHNCVLEAQSMDCFMLGGSTALGAGIIGADAGAKIGSKIGNHAANAYKSIIMQQPSQTQQKINKAFEIFHKEKALQEKAFNELRTMQDQFVREKTNGKYYSLNSLERSAHIKGQTSENLLVKLNNIETAFEAKWRERIAKETDSEYKQKLQSLDSYGQKTFNPELLSLSQKQKLMELFPNEFKQLKPFYDKIHDYEIEKQKLLSSKNPAAVSDKILEITNLQLTERFILDNYLNNPNNGMTRLVHEFVQRGKSSVEKISFADMSARAESIVGKEKMQNAEREIQRKTKRFTATGAQIGGVIGGTASVVAIDILAQDQGQIDLRSCQTRFQMSSEEIDFLANGKLFSPAQVIKSNGLAGSCESMILTDPQATIQQSLARFGGIPKGLCNLMKKETQQLNDLVGNTKPPEQVSCQKIQSPDYKVIIDNERSSLSVQDEDHSYDISTLDYAGNYIDMRSLKVTDTKRKEEDRRLKNEIQTGYSFLHTKEFATRPDLADSSLNCSQSQAHEGLRKFCRIRPKIFAARIAMQMQKSVCALTKHDIGSSNKTTIINKSNNKISTEGSK